MSTHILGARPAHAPATPAAALAPARPFAAPESAGSMAAPPAARHEFGAISVGPAAAQPIQRAGGKVHHNPQKKKHIAKGVGTKQVAVSNKALKIKQSVGQGQQISNKEAARRAKASLNKPKKNK